MQASNPTIRRESSGVATRARTVTQPQAARLRARHRRAAGLRWWSTYEAGWANVILFDRAVPHLRVQHVRTLTVEDPDVLEAAEFFGMRVTA